MIRRISYCLKTPRNFSGKMRVAKEVGQALDERAKRRKVVSEAKN